MSWIDLMYTQKEDIKAKILEYEAWRRKQMENPFQPIRKDMRTVSDYNKKRQLEMFRFSCFNSACVIVGGWISKDTALNHQNTANIVFELAENLYNESLKRDYLKLEAKENERI